MYLAVYCEHLQLQRRELTEPAVLVAKERIVQVNETAHKQGVKQGMGLASAAALCGALHVYPYEQNVEQQQLQELAAQCYQLTGDIILCASDCLIFAAASMRVLYPSNEALFHALAPTIRAFVPQFYYACASSMEAAEVLARYKANFISDDEQVCAQRLAQVPVQALLLSDEHKQQLARLGINTTQQLLALPLAQLRQRFHYELVDYLTRLRGQLQRASLPKKSRYYRFYQPAQYFSETQELNFEIEDSARLLTPLTQLCERICVYLRQHQWHTQQLTFTLLFREQPQLNLILQSVEPQSQLAPWLRLLTIKLDALKLTAPVIAVRLQCDEFVTVDGSSRNLFEKRQQGLARQQLLSVLHTRLGEERCYRLLQGRAHIPEYAQVQESTLHAVNTAIEQKAAPYLRPNFLITPTALTEPLCILRGPERIQSHWWQQEQVERDYYVGENNQGQLCWVFKDKQQQWFVQGYFA
ncbi:DNA polymerase Y family protein [Pseudoalteromonas sp. YIC-656]|uniref:Y-family DNA polymerase n=1 Tax=Pseudoalteromonas pernae TaxID=3118054 RepID=UPI003242F5DE